MAGEWRAASVLELQRAGVLLVEDGNHGEYRPLPNEFIEAGTPFVRPDDLKDGRVDFPNCDQINDRAVSRVRKGKGRAGDILFTHRATVGRIARAGDDAPNFVPNPGVTIWRSTYPDILDPVYLYFFMQTSTFMDQVWAEAGNTDTFPYVSLTQQRGLNISFPCVSRQRAIARVLGALDDKIGLNRRINETLEAMARALFKSSGLSPRRPRDGICVLMIDIELHREELKALCWRFHVRRLDLFGSAARGDFDPERSDMDFLAEFDGAHPEVPSVQHLF
jgi:type I restriction enzyme S subunit